MVVRLVPQIALALGPVLVLAIQLNSLFSTSAGASAANTSTHGFGISAAPITAILFVLVFGGAWATKQARLTLRVLASYQFHTNPIQRTAFLSSFLHVKR